MSTLKININLKSLERTINSISNRIKEESYRLSEEVIKSIMDDIKKNCPVDTGSLRNSFQYKIEFTDVRVKAVITSDKHYLKYVLYGTGIYNKNGRKTPWVYRDSDGNYHYTYGQRPNNFIRKSVLSNKKYIKSYIIQRLGDRING